MLSYISAVLGLAPSLTLPYLRLFRLRTYPAMPSSFFLCRNTPPVLVSPPPLFQYCKSTIPSQFTSSLHQSISRLQRVPSGHCTFRRVRASICRDATRPVTTASACTRTDCKHAIAMVLILLTSERHLLATNTSTNDFLNLHFAPYPTLYYDLNIWKSC
jgi:hypothetical protein